MSVPSEGTRASKDEKGWKGIMRSQISEPLKTVGLGLTDEWGRPDLRKPTGPPHMRRTVHLGTPISLLSVDWIRRYLLQVLSTPWSGKNSLPKEYWV